MIDNCCKNIYIFSNIMEIQVQRYSLAVKGSVAEVDWGFLDRIYENRDLRPRPVPEEERVNFTFEAGKYHDAVIMPWYRNQDQPQVGSQISYSLNNMRFDAFLGIKCTGDFLMKLCMSVHSIQTQPTVSYFIEFVKLSIWPRKPRIWPWDPLR
jgi:hypothetical protein